MDLLIQTFIWIIIISFIFLLIYIIMTIIKIKRKVDKIDKKIK
jgi:uncharacterized protein YoxC